jgi:hypothetical protein
VLLQKSTPVFFKKKKKKSTPVRRIEVSHRRA